MPRFLWPPRCRMNFYDGWNRLRWTSTDRTLDLEDSLMTFSDRRSKSLIFGMITLSKTCRWSHWTESNVSYIEEAVREDICFDGFLLTMRRISVPGSHCCDEFKWHLRIRNTM